MTVAELYEMFDDVSDLTKINIFVSVPNGHHMASQLFFSGRFN